ncbi:MAG: histidine phosphatase family protein [Candidatus Melainabacteria bacterium]|nr:MAG: histidine phosphatase family protein [Candidatus Melainabacteria bacterium]
MRKLILSRHGNTFGPNDRIVWVGAKNDLPLVETGIAQAQKLASALLANGITLDAIYCGPLRRTKEYADIVRQSVNPSIRVIVDERLNELDYGEWSGLNDQEIIQKFGAEDLENWNDQGLWPPKGSWGGSDSEIFQEVEAFTAEVSQRHKEETTILAVTSNGRLRYFLRLFPETFADYRQKKMLKVGTGKICLLARQGSALMPLCWNAEPHSALALTTGLPIKN